MKKEVKKQSRKIKKTRKLKEAEGYVKSAFLAAFLLIVFIGGTGLSQLLGKSYAAIIPIEKLPDTLTSKVDARDRVHYISSIDLPKRFYGVDGTGNSYELYCLERWLGMNGEDTYTKTSASSELSKLNIDDKKMAYLLSQIYPNNDDFLSDVTTDSAEKKYISQLTIWYFQDRNAGYQDAAADQCDTAHHQEDIKDTVSCEDKNDDGEYYWINSLLKNEKEEIKQSKYWKDMSEVIEKALAYQENTNYSLSVNKNAINYTLIENDKYLESTFIDVSTTGSNFKGYSLSTANQNITFYNEQGTVVQKGTTLQAGEKFKFRIPVEDVRKSKNLTLDIQIKGTFESKEAFMYTPALISHQRALIGTMQIKPIETTLDLQIADPMGSVRISKIDATNGEEVPGATLVVTDSNGKEIARWVSTNEPYYIDPIKEGKYTLTETIAPEGYVMSTSSVEFTVVAGETTAVEMQNIPEIDVPDTAATLPTYVYVVGALALLIGIGLIYVSLKPRHE